MSLPVYLEEVRLLLTDKRMNEIYPVNKPLKRGNNRTSGYVNIRCSDDRHVSDVPAEYADEIIETLNAEV